MSAKILRFKRREYQRMVEELKRYGMLYLATPYSKYPGGIEEAFEKAAKATAALIEVGVIVYSPIVHSHPAAIHGNIDPHNHEIWLPFNEAMMKRSDALVVVKMFTWESSFGIAEEIKFFTAAKKPIHYFDPITLPEPFV
jgi:hypothetical protein